MCVSSQSIIINKSSYTSRPHALGASTLATLLRQILTSNPVGGEFSCKREQSIKLV